MADFGWNISNPGDTVTIGSLPGHNRDVRDQVATVLDKEHTARLNGSANDGSGWEHKIGSAVAYVQAAEPTLRPDGTTTLTTAVDKGRLWVDSDDDTLYYFKDSTDKFTSVAIAGGIAGTAIVLLAGRSGGQTIQGGTATTNGLTLGANAASDATGTIKFNSADTADIDFDNIPISKLTLKTGATFDANSVRLTDVGDATTAKDTLTLGAAVITGSELSTTGGVLRGCKGTATGAGASLTADIGFAPEFIIAWNLKQDGARNGFIWSSDNASKTHRIDNMDETTTAVLSVSGNIITFPDSTSSSAAQRLNENTENFSYYAFKFNKTVNPT